MRIRQVYCETLRTRIKTLPGPVPGHAAKESTFSENYLKFIPMPLNVSRWLKKEHGDSKFVQITHPESKWFYLIQILKCIRMTQHFLKCIQMTQNYSKYINTSLNYSKWIHLTKSNLKFIKMAPHLKDSRWLKMYKN